MGDYYRAAQIAFLARKVGAARSATKNILLGFSLYIRDSIDKSRFTPETYIDQILDDADAAVSSAE